ncbi:MAG: xanthine dehydrogenase accessory protein XdhC [Pseudomonadota bacterium]|nr:xanthine dehydrogenase accessory protein XdhC [Pseudomonadota bacterium]
MIFSHFAPDDERFLSLLARQPAVLVRVASTQGSVPREAGAWMAVFADAVVGTVGGGHLEHQAIAIARARLGAGSERKPGKPGKEGKEGKEGKSGKSGKSGEPAEDEAHQGEEGKGEDGKGDPGEDEAKKGEARRLEEMAPVLVRFALGPSLGQCCGGVVQLRFEPVSACDAPALALALRPVLTPVGLFGAGHVGQALVQLLSSLPFLLTWIDSREEIFPEPLPARVLCEPSAPVQAAVPGLAPQSRVLIMSFSHAEDLEVLAACLKRQRDKADLPYIGLIGSRSKWAAFQRRLHARGFTPAELAHVTCPIGVSGISGKAPKVIAVAVAAQLLQTLEHP